MPAKSRPSSIWRSQWLQIKTMHRAGTFSVDATCPSRSTLRHTRHTSKPSTATGVTLHSGAVSVCCTIRSTSIAMRWTPTRVLFDSTPIFRRSGTTLEPCTSPAITRPPMHLTRTSARPILTLRTFTSRPACSFSRTVKDQLALPTRATLLYLKMFIPKLTSLPLSTALLLLSGVPSLRSRLRDLLHPLSELLAGIVLWLRLGSRACHLSLSIPTSSVRESAHQLSMLPSVQ